MNKKIAVLASGSGSNFQALINHFEAHPNVEISLLIASKAGIGAIGRATRHGIPVRVLPSSKISPSAYEIGLLNCLEHSKADLVVCAGFLSLIPEVVIQQYRNRIINIHPSLLPKYGGKGFYGLKVHQAVIEAQEKESGCTVHMVDERYDEGSIIAQRVVAVKESDTPESLAARILEEEHILLPSVAEHLLFSPEDSNNQNF